MSASDTSITSQEPSPGTRLRQARESAGLTLVEVAQRSLIPVARLQSLEKDDYNQVGVATFVMGYTRTYARILGIDPTPLVQQLEDRLASQSAVKQQTPSVALSLEVRKRPGSIFWPLMWLFMGLLVVVAIMGISALGVFDSPTPSLAPPVVPAPQVNRAAPLRTPLPEVQTRAPDPTLDGQAEQPEEPSMDTQTLDIAIPAEEPLRPAEDSSSLMQEQESSGQLPTEPLADPDFAAVETAPELPLPAPAFDSPPAELVLRLTDDCWVDVTDATGKRIVARNVASGDNLRLFGQAPFDVILGNAAAVEMTLNGQPVDTTPPVGRRMLRLSVAK